MDLDDDIRDSVDDPFFAVFDKMRARRVSREDLEEDALELAADDPLDDDVKGTSTPPIRRRLAFCCE